MRSLPHETKVVVIGGGIAGCSTAYHLAKNGWDTVLIERDVLTSGTTWHAAGMITQLGTTPQITKIRKNSIRFYKDLEKFALNETDTITCEVNIKPKNTGSMLFHKKYGFCQVGTQYTENRKKEVSLMKYKIKLV